MLKIPGSGKGAAPGQGHHAHRHRLRPAQPQGALLQANAEGQRRTHRRQPRIEPPPVGQRDTQAADAAPGHRLELRAERQQAQVFGGHIRLVPALRDGPDPAPGTALHRPVRVVQVDDRVAAQPQQLLRGFSRTAGENDGGVHAAAQRPLPLGQGGHGKSAAGTDQLLQQRFHPAVKAGGQRRQSRPPPPGQNLAEQAGGHRRVLAQHGTQPRASQ